MRFAGEAQSRVFAPAAFGFETALQQQRRPMTTTVLRLHHPGVHGAAQGFLRRGPFAGPRLQIEQRRH